jgi:hypothetical protein
MEENLSSDVRFQRFENFQKLKVVGSINKKKITQTIVYFIFTFILIYYYYFKKITVTLLFTIT